MPTEVSISMAVKGLQVAVSFGWSGRGPFPVPGNPASGGGGRNFNSKIPRTVSNLPDFPRRPFLCAHLCFYT